MYKRKKETKKRLAYIAMGILTLIAFVIGISEPETLLSISASFAIIPIWGSVADKTFKEMKAEDVAKLSVDDQIKYFNELNIYKADQIVQLKIQLKEDTSKEIKEQIKALREEVAKDNRTQMESLIKTIEKQGLAINRMMIGNGGGVPSIKTIEDQLYEIKDKVVNAAKETVTIKTDITTASVSGSTFAHEIDGVGQLATLKTKLVQLFSPGTIGDGEGGVVRYVDQLAVTRNAAFKAEGAVKGESAITWVVRTLSLQTVADTIPYSNQSLSNIPFLATEIRNFLLKNLALKIDKKVYNGTGVDPEIFGVYTRAAVYTAVASGISTPNIFDLISLMRTAIMKESSYEPNKILITHSDRAKYMTVEKDGNGNYILPWYVEYIKGVMYVHGMEVVESSSVNDEELVVGDFTYGTIFTHGGVKVDIGLIDKQFVENMVTLRAETEIGLLIRNVHQDAFIRENDISAAITTIGT